MSQVPIEKKLAEAAKKNKKFVVTIAVNGKLCGDDSMSIQRLADVKMAQEVCAFGLRIMKQKDVVKR